MGGGGEGEGVRSCLDIVVAARLGAERRGAARRQRDACSYHASAFVTQSPRRTNEAQSRHEAASKVAWETHGFRVKVDARRAASVSLFFLREG